MEANRFLHRAEGAHGRDLAPQRGLAPRGECAAADCEVWFRAAIGDLKELTDLNVGGNQLTALPDTLGALTGLTELWAYSNKLSTLPDSIAAALTRVKKLNLYNNKFTTLPKPIIKLTSLIELNLCNNQLVILPDSIAALMALEELYLFNNKLVTLPDSIAALTALETLNLGSNPLAKQQSSAVEAWLTALRAGSCTLYMPADGRLISIKQPTSLPTPAHPPAYHSALPGGATQAPHLRSSLFYDALVK